MGIFLSINGWSDGVPKLLRQNPNKNIILMNGEDLRYVLEEKVRFPELLKGKMQRLHFHADPFYCAQDYIRSKGA